MALKDWKKRKGWMGGGTLYDNKKDNYHKLLINYTGKVVEISDGGEYESREFKTKSQALSYAKSYMRKN